MKNVYQRWLLTAVATVAVGSVIYSPANATTADEALSIADMTRAATQRIAVQQAVMAIASESADSDGDGYSESPAMLVGAGPVGGGIIPLTSSAPKDDSYGIKLGYCAWDNGTINSSAGRITGAVNGYTAPVFAVISSGIDNAFQTTCADIAAGTGAKGDDFVIAYNSNQLHLGVGGTLYFGDPVVDITALNSLNTATIKDGQTRLVKSTNALYRWNAGTTSWTAVVGLPWVASGAGYVSASQIAVEGGGAIGLANGSYFSRVGSETGLNLVSDASGLQARNNGTVATLNLNSLGGNVTLGGNMTAWNSTTPGVAVGALHLGTVSATSNAGSAITFEARDGGHGVAQAGIYVQSDSSYGTKMLFGTTDLYTVGAKTALMIDHHGDISITRGSLNLGGAGTGISVFPGAFSDPYGAIAVTRPGDGNSYSYFGMTRQSQVGYNFGIDASNRFFIGTGTSGYGNANVANRFFTVDYGGNVNANGTINGNNMTINGAQVLSAANFSLYTPTLTGAGASGTWNINVNGNAGSVPWSGVTGKPTTIAGYGITDFVSSNSGSPVAADSTTTNGVYYVNSNISLFGQTDGALHVQSYSSAWAGQIYQDYRTGQLAVRGKNSGTWQGWRTIVDNGNIGSYAPSLTGAGASGTWGISITGSANVANYVNSPDGDRNAATKLPTGNRNAVRFDFVGNGSTSTGGNYAGVMTYAPWDGTSASTGGPSYQLAFGSSAANGGTPQLNIRNGIDSSWNAWYTIWHSGNSNPVNKTGDTMTGTLNAPNIYGNASGLLSSAGSSYYDIGGGRIAAGKSIYSYGLICVGNPSGDCTAAGGAVISSSAMTIGGSNVLTAANINNSTITEINNNGWYRSNGNTGWFSSTYGGGIYMVDTSWVRAYNGKSFLTEGWLYAGAGLEIAGNVVIDGSRNFTGGAVTASNYVQPGAIASNGAGCAAAGSIGRDGSGNLFVCN